MKNYAEYVNPFIGTIGLGHALVGPQRPHGMLKLLPDTIKQPCGGYDYSDGKIFGFSHTHLEGVGGRGGRGNIMFTATNGPLEVEEEEFASLFSHNDEKAEVGYYQVRLTDYDINVELAATEHCGYHRYTFPKGKDNRVLLDLGHTLGNALNNCYDANLKIIDKQTVCGGGKYALSGKGSNPFEIYFYAKLSVPAAKTAVWNKKEVKENACTEEGSKIGAIFYYPDADYVDVTVGISYVGVEHAKKSLEKEIPEFDFDKCVTDTKNVWNELLSRISVEGNDEDSRIQFYSALYRALNQPTDYREYDKYLDALGEEKIYDSEGRSFYSDDWALWDTFRSTHPLQNLIEPERASDMITTFTRIYEHGGWLPMCTGPSVGYNQTMIGHNASSVIIDCMVTGAENYDSEKAYAAVKKQATEPNPDEKLRMLGTHPEYLKHGYMPHEVAKNDMSVSETLEYVYGDWCAAQIAKRLGKTEDYEQFIKRSKNYKNLFNKELGFMNPRFGNGEFSKDFRPTDAFKNGFTETTSWEHTFFVPHDVKGLINLIGGNEEFIERLDEFFAENHYNNQNETGIQVPYLYNYAGAPWKTNETVLNYVRNYHFNKPDGLMGEDDAGAMSAWYALSAAGFFPVCPGQGVYALTTPNFEKIKINTGSAVFTVTAHNFAKENLYIVGALLNGKPYNKTYITIEELKNGGELELYLGNTPSDWGTAADSVPPSLTEADIKIKIDDAKIVDAKPDGSFEVEVTVTNEGPECTYIAKPKANGLYIGKKRIGLMENETVTARIVCRVYKNGVSEVTIDGVSCGTVETELTGDAKLTCEKAPKLSEVMSFEDSIKPLTITAVVKNTGAYKGTDLAVLRVNGAYVDAVEVTLESGEEAEVQFTVTPTEKGRYCFSVCGGEEAVYDVAGDTDSRFYSMSSSPYARFAQNGNNIFIKANGAMQTHEHAFLFEKHKIKGNFEAQVAITYEDFTCPYAQTGFVIRNEIGSGVRTGEVIVGGMTQRGFYNNAFVDDKTTNCHPGNCKGTPICPYWIKVRKEGKTFYGAYSFDGDNWIDLPATVQNEAAESQYLGLYSDAGTNVPKLVRFTDYKFKRID